MAKTDKATKKFQNKHLKDTIKHRKNVQKYNKRRGSKKSISSGPAEKLSNRASSKANQEVFDGMSVDEFMSGGFEVPKEKSFKDAKMKDNEESEESSSEEENEEQMKEELEGLAEKDPEFYKYLQNNDRDLLDFERENPLDAMSEEDDDDEKEPEKKNEYIEEDNRSQRTELTAKLVKDWNRSLEEPNVKLVKEILVAFRAAVNINRASEENYKYSVTNPSAFQSLLILTLKKLPIAVQKMVKYKVKDHSEVRSLPQTKTASQLASLFKSHSSSYITLLKDITNTETAVLVFSSLGEIFPYFVSFRRVVKEILSGVVDVWTTTTDIETQIAAFAFLNNIAKEFKKSLLDTILRLMYSTFLKNSRKTNIYTMPMINFSKNAASELFSVDEVLSYQIGFEYVRQLAIHLRNSISATSKAKEGYKTIYNWQYCHALDFWSRVIAHLSNPERELQNQSFKDSPMRQLIYPLVQVTFGTIRLIPTAQFFPLRFYLIRSLIRLSQATGIYIPIFPLLSEILTSTSITKSPRSSSLQAFDFDHNIKVNQAYLGTKAFQDGLTEQFIELSSSFFALYSKSIAFPELCTPAVISLRRFIKGSKNFKFNKQLQQLVEKLNANAKFIEEKRSNVDFGPSNKREVQFFLKELDWQKTPLGQYVVVQQKLREEKARILRESLAQEEKEKAEKEEGESDINMGDFAEEDNSENESEVD